MKFKSFQKQDLARAALHDGLVLSWDTGLWKTGAMYAWSLLKVGFHEETNSTLDPGPSTNRRIVPNAPVLLVVPGDLHRQTIDEGREKFHVETTSINSQDDFRRLCVSGPRPSTLVPRLPNGFYITSYTQLTTNGVQDLPNPDKLDPRALLAFLCLPISADSCAIFPDSPAEAGSVVQFFGRRYHRKLWRDHFDIFKLDWRTCVWKELEGAHLREQCRLDRYEDHKAAQDEQARLSAAFHTLKRLIPTSITDHRSLVTFQDLSNSQQTWVIREFCRRKLEVYAQGIGELRRLGEDPSDASDSTAPKIRCLYSPSLADLCFDSFTAVCIDEAVKMKGEDTIVGRGVRQMEAPYRLVCTATPVKNRLPDIFRLAWWAAGGKADAHARFPYADSSADRNDFAKTFLMSERNLTKEEKGSTPAPGVGARAPARASEKKSSGSRYKKLTAEVCNIHRLWKLLGPIVLRRRKADCGEDIVPRIRHVVRCEMGTEQRQVYQYHLKAHYLDKNGQVAIGAQLQALRIAAADPASQLLQPVDGGTRDTCPECAARSLSAFGGEGQGEVVTISPHNSQCPVCHGRATIQLPSRSSTSYIPKMAVTLNLIREILERKEQVIVFSAFNDPNDYLSARLREAGVRHQVLDGRTSQKQRGLAAAQFKKGRFQPSTLDSGLSTPALLAGVECMAEGHSFHRCNNAILIAYSWAADKFKQALDRVHRLISEKPVNVYVVLCQGTIDRKLESLTQEKTDAAELVLDGRLIGESQEEINFAELLQIARDEFDQAFTPSPPRSGGEGRGEVAPISPLNTVDEDKLHAEWPKLRAALGRAMRAWDDVPKIAAPAPTVIAPIVPITPLVPPEIPVALHGLPPGIFSITMNEPKRLPTLPTPQPFKPSTVPMDPADAPPPPSKLPAWRQRIKARAAALLAKSRAEAS